MKNSGQSSTEAFQSVCGKEKPGRVRCHGRTTTPSLLKKNKEITYLKKRHADEVKQLNDKLQEIEEKRSREMAEVEEKRRQEAATMEQKFQLLLKTVLNPKDSVLSLKALVAMLSTGDENNVSTSTHTTNNKVRFNYISCFTLT